MKSEWKEYKLEDICIKITDGSHYSPKPQAEGFPMFSVKDMGEYNFCYTNCKYISLYDYKKMQQNDCVPQKGDILVAKDGSYLKQIFVCKETKEEAILSSIAIFRPNTKIVLPTFLSYLLKSPDVYNHIKLNCVSGSALPRIVLKDFKKIELTIPDFERQRKIAAVLSALDDKIELNNKTNENLEQQLVCLYNAIFKNNTQYCELGSVVDTTSGGTPSRKKDEYYKNGSICWVKSKELTGTYLIDTEEKITEVGLSSSSAKIIPSNSTLIAMYGATVGEYGIISKPMTCNQAVCALIPNENFPFTVVFMFAMSNKNNLINLAIGSAQQNISQILIRQMKICCDLSLNKRFHDIAEPIFEKIKEIVVENQRLSALRDTLLPKLMNGEIDVSEVKI